MGGYANQIICDKIYFAMSKDLLCNNNSIASIWQTSQIVLPQALHQCKCLITHQNTNNPKLIVLGGCDCTNQTTKTFLEFELCDIIGYNTFIRFMLNFEKVKQKIKIYLFVSFFCVCVVCVCVCVMVLFCECTNN